jgi:hypothetical protein
MKIKDPWMVIKTNMANYIDHVKHSFMFSVLKSYGFFDSFIN